MINKVEKLISIGKFRNYSVSGPMNFQKLTTVFGDNGGGKTTLTSVLRSLTQNDPEIIRSRISTNHVSPQAAQLSYLAATGTTFHTFGASGWTNPINNIEIFDIHFVNGNVYSGFDFSDDHRKKLHQFVIGAQGVALQQKIEKNKSDKISSRANIQNLENKIVALVGNNLSTSKLSQFLAIKSTASVNIDSKISTATKDLQDANSNSVIATLKSLIQIQKISSPIKFKDLVNDLSATTKSIQGIALRKLFETHCAELKEFELESPENWIKQGFDALEKKVIKTTSELACPFCKQPITSSLEIIQAYTLLFDEEFNNLVLKTGTYLKDFQLLNSTSIAQSFKIVTQQNDNQISAWKIHLASTVVEPKDDIIEEQSKLVKKFEDCIKAIKKKIENPSIPVTATCINEFVVLLKEINQRIEQYNTKVVAYNAAITNFTNNIKTVQLAQETLDKLKQTKLRFDTVVDGYCSQLSAENLILKNLTADYPILVNQQETAVSIFFTKYKDRINYYLTTVFKTSFTVDGMAHIPPAGKAIHSKIGYKLVIDGKDISFNENMPFSAKECLSEGDKTTIALAFFLSKLDIDPDKDKKILVFDDPLSSLDTNRRTYTISVIRSLVSEMKQVIVLSHNEHFLYEICKDFPNSATQTLRITENFATKASILALCNLDELVKNEYFKNLEALIKFRTTPDHAKKDIILGYLRNVLEAHIRFKFYNSLAGMPGQKTFGSLILYIERSGIIFRDNLNRTDILRTLKLINSVSWIPHHGIPAPNYSIYGLNPTTITAAELDVLIQDTLNLIDNQL